MTESPFVTEEEIANTPGPTYGLTSNQIRYDIRNGYLPGKINYRRRIEVRRSEWNAYLAGDWKPGTTEEPAESRKPVGIHSVSKAS